MIAQSAQRAGRPARDRVQRTFSDVHGLMSIMLAKTLPLLLLCACAATLPTPAASQAGTMRQLQAVGISRVISPGDGAMVRLETGYGPVYVRYPASVAPAAFVVDVDAGGAQARDETVLAALLPEAVRVTAANNQREWLRANPWH